MSAYGKLFVMADQFFTPYDTAGRFFSARVCCQAYCEYFMFILEALEKVQKEEKGRMGGGRMGGKAPPPPKLDKAEEDSKAFSKELAR